MSSSGNISIVLDKLTPRGQQRLFEFLDIIDTATAARFRSWLGGAPDNAVQAVADVLNRASHGREVAAWWQAHDKPPGRTTPQGPAQAASTTANATPVYSERGWSGRRGFRNAGIPYIAVGYLLSMAAPVFIKPEPTSFFFGLFLGIISLVLIVGGCMKYAEEKGHSKWIGLVGLLSCVGLLILLMLPDRLRRIR